MEFRLQADDVPLSVRVVSKRSTGILARDVRADMGRMPMLQDTDALGNDKSSIHLLV